MRAISQDQISALIYIFFCIYFIVELSGMGRLLFFVVIALCVLNIYLLRTQEGPNRWPEFTAMLFCGIACWIGAKTASDVITKFAAQIFFVANVVNFLSLLFHYLKRK